MKTPGPGQHGGCYAKCDDVGERVQLTAEIAAGTGHASNTAIETVKQNSEADGYGSIVQVSISDRRRMEHFQDGIKTGGHISTGKQRWENVHPFAHVARWALRSLLVFHQRAPSLVETEDAAVNSLGCTKASTLAPPRTRSPTFTSIEAAASRRTSTREPNLIKPIRCPRFR